MIIERRIRINNRNYYLGMELMYGQGKVLAKMSGSSFDMGDLSIMIECIEKDYDKESKELIYDNDISYMNDILYLYDRFPFVSYIKDSSYDKEGNITSSGCINKNEIINYIDTNKINMNRWDKKNCRCPLLYE